MGFGARVLPEDGVEFRLFAPAAVKAELCLLRGPGREFIGMGDAGGGWRAATVPEAGHGTLYCYRINGETLVPDPASRFQPQGTSGPGEVIDPEAFEWTDGQWRARPWEEAVFYELHIGAATARGTFDSLKERLDYIADLGATAIELMPVNSFPGERNWGYDGVLLFAPANVYGRPEDLKSLVCEAHARGLMVFLDVVYNHFGPVDNYLGLYAPQFFTSRRATPWGDAINFDGDGSGSVREFFMANALYWLFEYNFDGLRLDATDWIMDDTRPDFLTETARAIRARAGYEKYLVIENDDNPVEYIRRNEDGGPRLYNAVWNEDLHHCLHTLATGETGSYYADYKKNPAFFLARSLTEGYAQQGEWSEYRRKNRGGRTRGLYSASFVAFTQNHDQVGNRPMGDRIHRLAAPEAVRAITEIFLLSPAPPLIFMGQEYNSESPFPFFSDISPELAQRVREGRLGYFSERPLFGERYDLGLMPDPFAEETYQSAKLDFERIREPAHASWHGLYRRLLDIRKREIIPRIKGVRIGAGGTGFAMCGRRAFRAWWRLDDGNMLTLAANLCGEAAECELPDYPPIYETGAGARFIAPAGAIKPRPRGYGNEPCPRRLQPWTVMWFAGRPASEIGR